MKQPIAVRIIEFQLKLTMANTCNIFAAFAVAFLTFLSLSSAFVNQDFDISKDFQKNLDLELQPFLREKREEDVHLVNKHPLELEELSSESQTIQDRRAIPEETKKLNHKDDRKNEEPNTNNDIEEDVMDDVFSYKSMHDLIQAFILADEQDIAMRLQQLREIENATEKLSNLPKRQVSASAAAAASAGGLLGLNMWDPVPLADLDTHSCEGEAGEYGHVHFSGLVVHEFFCELRKMWHYFLIVIRNLREGLSLGPLFAESVIDGGRGIFGILFHIPRLLHTILREPHHLLIFPDILRDCVPFPSIFGAFRRLLHTAFKVVHFVHELHLNHIRHFFGHFFHLHRLSLHLRERLLERRLARLHHLHGLSSILPLGEEIVGESVVPTIDDGGAIVAPDYRTSLAEVLSSLRGAYNGYHASGIPHLIRTGMKSISTSKVYSKVISYVTNMPSYLSNIPSYLTNIRSYLPRMPSFSDYTPLQQGPTVTATSTASASSSVSTPVSPVVSPVVEPIINPTIASIAPVETVSSSASASATVTETQPMVSGAPLISTVPDIISSVPVVPSFDAASAAATAAATSAAAAASAASAPLIEPVTSEVVSETVENTVSESSSSNVAVASPEVVPGFSGNTAAAASASASASSSDVSPAISTNSMPFRSPYSLTGYRSRPILSGIRPAISSIDSLIEPGQYRGLDLNLGGRIPLSRSHSFPAALPSAASAAAAAASSAAGSAAAASSASTASSGGLNFVLPREQIVNALGHNYLTPGDIISLNLRNRATLIGRVLDTVSPISFNFLRPKLRASLLHHGGRVWNLSPWDFKDPECVRRLNSPHLLRHAF
ncbi:uncharacterized protein LOC105250201 [Camponotus floridanus]|uniref:uncharacterized protein LOC105250201 n=1 Tax=Camponotus floridanus TaxID=104421 RepID=UPI000DC6B411|nr:uncharacterized protein LOC105250201 [Camponotus floridanus]